MLDLEFVDVVGGLMLRIGVVEVKRRILDILRDAVNSDFRFMDDDLWVGARNGVDLTTLCLLFE